MSPFLPRRRTHDRGGWALLVGCFLPVIRRFHLISDFNGNYGEMLADVAADLLHDSDPRLSLGKIFRRVSPHTSSRIWLAFAPRGERPQLVFAGGLSLNLADLQQPSYSASLSELAARPPGASPLSFEEAPADPVLQLLAQAGVRTLVNYTLSSGARLVGSLVFASHATSGFTPGEMKFHQALADEIAIAFGRDLLQEELARKDLQLLATATELQRAQAELEQIALVASHDLREPVRHLSIYAELLDRSLQPNLDREAAQYLRFLLTSAKRVELLVADLLAYTGIRHDEPSPRPVDPEIVAARVCWRLRELIQQSGAQIRLKPLPALYMGEDDLALFLENLIESCLRRSSPDVTPLICIYSEGTS